MNTNKFNEFIAALRTDPHMAPHDLLGALEGLLGDYGPMDVRQTRTVLRAIIPWFPDAELEEMILEPHLPPLIDAQGGDGCDCDYLTFRGGYQWIL